MMQCEFVDNVTAACSNSVHTAPDRQQEANRIELIT